MAILYIIATPIGNLEDITLRALRIFSEIDVLACEDTRVTKKIFLRHNIDLPGTVISYHEHNEGRAGSRILEFLQDGKTVGLCTDSGSPAISDPGYRIIDSVLSEGYRVEIIPGPSAVIAGLIASGLATSSFTFKGFPPRKKGELKRFFELEKESRHTLVFYESPYRVSKSLAAAMDVLGNRLAAVCIEMTKKFERTHRGFLQELIPEFSGKKIRGEVTVVIAGSNPKFTKGDDPGPHTDKITSPE